MDQQGAREAYCYYYTNICVLHIYLLYQLL